MTPTEWLAKATAGIPGAVWRTLDEMRTEKGQKLPDWPEWCFLPFHGWYALACMIIGKKRLAIKDTAFLQALAVAGTWRVTQDVVRFDETLYRALVETPVTGNLPSSTLTRLPAWCVYLETPGMEAQGMPVAGVWAMLDHDKHTSDELRLFLFDGETVGLFPVVLQLGDWPIEEAIERPVNMDMLGDLLSPERAEAAVSEAKQIACIPQILSLLLYLCTYGFPRSDMVPPERPAYPKPKKVKGGWRLFPAQKPTVRTVGESIGKRLRDAEAQELQVAPARELGTHASPRPHIRRGHWHGFWHGPRDGERQLKIRWLPPIAVAMGDDGED